MKRSNEVNESNLVRLKILFSQSEEKGIKLG